MSFLLIYETPALYFDVEPPSSLHYRFKMIEIPMLSHLDITCNWCQNTTSCYRSHNHISQDLSTHRASHRGFDHLQFHPQSAPRARHFSQFSPTMPSSSLRQAALLLLCAAFLAVGFSLPIQDVPTTAKKIFVPSCVCPDVYAPVCCESPLGVIGTANNRCVCGCSNGKVCGEGIWS